MNRRTLHPGPSTRQSGLSLVILVIVAIIIGFFAVIAIKIIPTFVEYRAVMSAVKKAKASGNTVAGIQSGFDRSAAIDDITTISGKDLDITKIDDDIVVAFSYTKKIGLFGPVSLTIDYSGSSRSP